MMKATKLQGKEWTENGRTMGRSLGASCISNNKTPCWGRKHVFVQARLTQTLKSGVTDRWPKLNVTCKRSQDQSSHHWVSHRQIVPNHHICSIHVLLHQILHSMDPVWARKTICQLTVQVPIGLDWQCSKIHKLVAVLFRVNISSASLMSSSKTPCRRPPSSHIQSNPKASMWSPAPWMPSQKPQPI